MNANDIINALTPVLAILATYLVKLATQKVPKWALPLVATALGAALNLIGTYSVGTTNSVWMAIALGLGGTTIREVLKYLMEPAPTTGSASTGGTTPPTPKT